ncbi:uncharacterized protein G2W53_007924 [Senna tora]|uniref:DUF4283 domain-containing protein n=1 Tax=Senna tora TaxID=362788 RepID=A0A834X7U7_9FABA|nr:uncharacterized protein G2W53_007924 [Senna tora]
MENALKNIWNLLVGVQVEAVDRNLFLFHFTNEKDMVRVMEEGPWIFRNKWLTLTRWKRGMDGSEDALSKRLIEFDVKNGIRKGANLATCEMGCIGWTPAMSVSHSAVIHVGSSGTKNLSVKQEGRPWKREMSYVRKSLDHGITIATQEGPSKEVGGRMGRIKKNDNESLLEMLARMSVHDDARKTTEIKITSYSNMELEKTLENALESDMEEGAVIPKSKSTRAEERSAGMDVKDEKAMNHQNPLDKKESKGKNEMEESLRKATKGVTMVNVRLSTEIDAEGEEKRGTKKEGKPIMGSVTKWKRVAREKENVVPVTVIKKRLFNDLTNVGEGEGENGESRAKKSRQEANRVVMGETVVAVAAVSGELGLMELVVVGEFPWMCPPTFAEQTHDVGLPPPEVVSTFGSPSLVHSSEVAMVRTDVVFGQVVMPACLSMLIDLDPLSKVQTTVVHVVSSSNSGAG